MVIAIPVVHDCSVGMTFRDPRAQLTLHVWLNFGRYFFLFYRTLERRGYSFRFRIRRIERLPLRFVLPLSFHRLLLNNFLYAHVTYSDSESKESKGCYFCSHCLFQHLRLNSSCSPFHELQTQTKRPVQSNEL